MSLPASQPAKVAALISPESWLAGAVCRRDQPLSPQVYTLMRGMIVEGRAKPGLVLKEPAIANQLGVSRTPVREALLRLQQDGLVEMRPQSGTFVTPIDRDRVEEGMIVREALEPKAAAIAAEKISNEDLVALKLQTDRMAEAARIEDGRTFIEADDRFHRILVDASTYSHIGVIIDQVNAQLDRVRHLSANVPKRPEAAVREHHYLIERLTAGDKSGSAKALTEHLTASWVIIREIMEQLEQER